MSEQRTKKFRLFDAVLAVICIVFVAEAAAPVAAIGNSQYFWWLFLIITFLLPYGLISAELGTTYDDEGGLYDWVKRAFGERWGARVSWYYWLNFPLWMASLAVVFPEVISTFLGVELTTAVTLIIELAFVWIVVLISFFRVSDSKWILNLSAFIKVALALTLGGLGIYVAVTRGVANPHTFSSLLPSFDIHSLSFISVILFNFMGFEVVTSFAGDMVNPKKQIPQAIIAGGIAIAAIYIFSAFGIGVAIPTNEISTSSGLIDSMQLLSGQTTGLFITIVAILFLLTLFGNMVSWSYGVNYVASYAAKNCDMPKIYARENKNGMPVGAALMNGIVASVLLLIAPILPSEDLFWSFFALNIVNLLMSYLPVFPAFLKLRKIDGDRERPFTVSGGKTLRTLMAYVPMILLIIAIVFICIPFSTDPAELAEKVPLTIGVLISIILGEIMCVVCARRKRRDR